ncbi:hypothetical protein ROHU_004815 [Labeo rohita]|uniref:Uncharacterized protein n=1 Tax=Labeo rohita TaxID=84645 RepID=A0A498NH56_LABRO|nr:hypothetical protein ROHU_008275 [Labeo rohita]RXN31192.1 hypothetical protein ROHU_004815 [Labeo rohita]
MRAETSGAEVVYLYLEVPDILDELHEIQRREWGLRCRHVEPMISPLVHNLPNRPSTQGDHHDAGTAEFH